MPLLMPPGDTGRASAVLFSVTFILLLFSPTVAADRTATDSRDEKERGDRNVVSAHMPLIVRATAKACDATTSEERIKCKLQNAVDQAEDTAAMVMLMDDVPENHKHALMQETIRARRAESRSNKDDFKQMMKKNIKCQIVEQDQGIGEMDGDNDGICTGNEICVEVIGDGVGNDDEECSPRNGAKKEICAEVCDEEGLSIEENLDMDVGQELEDDLDRATSNFIELNDRLEEDMVLQARARQLVQSNDPCAAVMVGGLSRPPNVEDRKPNALLGAALVVRDFQSLQADLADKACSIDGAGFNVKVICAAFEALRAVAIIVATVQEIKRDNVTSATIETSFECIKKLDQEVDMTTGQLDAIKGRVAMLEQQLIDAMNELFEVTGLLKTPPGRRPDYPLP